MIPVVIGRILFFAAPLLGGCFQLSASAPLLNSTSARQALATYVEANPDIFSSPGQTVTAEEIRKVEVAEKTSGWITLGSFSVDLDARIYQLIRVYGRSGRGWLEKWIWKGSFLRDCRGGWKVVKPEIQKVSRE